MATSVLSSSSASSLSRRPSSAALLDSRPSSHPSEGRSSSTTNSTNNTNGPILLTTAQSTNKTILPQAGDVLSIEVQARNPRRRFPLSPEFLPQVTISREHIELLKRQCLVEMNRVLRKSNAVWAQSEQMFDGGEQEWRSHCTSKAHKMTLFRRKREDGTPAMRHFLARGQVANVTLADLEYGLYCDTTTDERAVKTDLYRELFLDAAVLQVFERQRPEDPFHFYGLKWLAYVSPADKFLSSRDYAFVEYSRTVETQGGEKLLIKVMVPVDSDIVSILPEREYDLVRGAMACTYMYKYDAAARAIQVFAEGSLDPSGSATSWMGKSFLTLLAPTIVNLENCADVKHFMKHGRVLSTDDFFTKVKEAKTSEAHKHCCACLKRFGSSLRKKTHASCRCCGQFMCSKCVISFTLCLPWHEKRDAEHPSAVRDEKFCLKCVCLVRAHRNDAKHQAQQPATVNQTSVDAAAIQMSRLNFENAPLPSREVVEEAHNAHTRFAGSRFVEERLRQMKERHLVRDKHRNNNQDPAPYPHQQPGQAEAFGRMEQSIAEQEELLRNLQYEHARREYQQRVAYQQHRQQTQLQAQQQYYLEHAAALSSSQRSIRASQAGWKPTASGMTNASISSSAYTADTFESSFDESDDDVFSISEDSDIYSPKRYGAHHSGSGRGMPPRSGQRHAGFV